jgi:hypothetical protein
VKQLLTSVVREIRTLRSVGAGARATVPGHPVATRKGCPYRDLFLRAKEEISLARKVGQIIARGDRRWLIRVYLGRDHDTQRRKYHNRTIHGPMR